VGCSIPGLAGAKGIPSGKSPYSSGLSLKNKANPEMKKRVTTPNINRVERHPYNLIKNERTEEESPQAHGRGIETESFASSPEKPVAYERGT